MAAAAHGGGGEFMSYADIEEQFNNMALEGPSAQDGMVCIVSLIISCLPPPLVPAPEADDSDDDHFSLTSSDSEDADANGPAQDGDGQDHFSRLPRNLLSNIMSRLPTKEAARTMVLSTRWRCVWAATPLLVDDGHFRAAEGHSVFDAVRGISLCVAAHPGSIRAVRITRTSFYEQEYALQRLVAGLAAKKIQDLILFNRPWPINMPLPDDILRCASLSRLYIGIWNFPDIPTAHRPAFPNLHELGLFHSMVEDKKFNALLAHCPELKILSFALSYNYPSCLRIKSRSLRVVLEWVCTFDKIIVDNAPCLERLLFESFSERRRPVKIVHASRLEVLGFLDFQLHALEIGGTVIRAGMTMKDGAMLPSLKILAVKVQFSHDKEVKMLHTLLRCFPCLETLHIMSIPSWSADRGDCAEAWNPMGSSNCFSHLKTFVLHGFRGLDREQLFVSYILEKGIKTLGIVCGDSDGVLVKGNAPSGGSSGSGISVCPATSCWSFQHAINLSVEDPFCVLSPHRFFC
ncbi:F-box/LRR-repeat protein At5g02910-like isoform X1 [Triticum urartu]|uniref:F-box domain-containing protein n=1 Tax=Triticum urartu TaxID=4572 RepID=A0A8R7UP99_TRIUA|nr:F-box/LRR-repeat protein At5g02910-like isoform X1 [Triticum urartu]XP_048534660.1 F-box/LRR-repeat protein At5g02910-like isoform X1 [Triticum urartu]XP_048534661.1 F-box/LRR-repeat protein At5g02910-like isoform X1 [Triticum urartu]